MMSSMNDLTDTCQWDQKVFLSTFANGWKHDALQGDEDVTPQKVDWVCDHLPYQSFTKCN